MKWISVVIFCCAFFLWRPYWAQDMGSLYTGDDESYFAHATAIVYGQFPSYDNEYFTMGSKVPNHPVGASLLAVPFVYAFSWADRLTGANIAIKRTRENIRSSWSLFGFVVATSVYFWLACFFLFRGLRRHTGYAAAAGAVIFMVLMQGIPLYIFRRPVFSHAYWFFLEAVLMYVLLRYGPGNFCRGKDWLKPVGLGLWLGLMALTRHNDVVMALVWPLVLVAVWPLPRLRETWPAMIKIYGSMGLLIGVFVLVLFGSSQVPGIDIAKDRLVALHPFGFYMSRLAHIFVGIDWGLIYLQPFLVIGLAWLFILGRKDPLRGALLILASTALVDLYIVMMWGTQASWYGYRYLFFILIPVLVYPLAMMIDAACRRWGRWIMLAGGLLAVFPFMAMLFFEATRTTWIFPGPLGWCNDTYSVEVFKHLLDPASWPAAIFRGGFFYWQQVCNSFWHWPIVVDPPAWLVQKYMVMNWPVFYQTVILYLIPFFFLGVFWKFEK